MAPGILWLTRDFRFGDNPALLAALKTGPLWPVFFVDQQLMDQGAASRWRLERSLRAFDAALKSRGGLGVTVLRGAPEDLLPKLLDLSGARTVHQSDWPAPEMRAVQGRVEARLHGALRLYPGHLLTHPQALQRGGGGAYRVYTPFARALHRLGPDQPVPQAPEKIDFFDPRGLDLGQALLSVKDLSLAPDLHKGRAALETFALPAGEAAAWARLDAFFEDIARYPEGRDRPDLEATSDLSEHLAVGEISARAIWAAASLHAEVNPQASAGIGKFLAELIWREFAWHLLLDFPQMAQSCWRAEWEGFAWAKTGAPLEMWRRASTGAALVDAGLRQMWLSGRMHNRVRMVVASYLTKHLLTDWRAGLAHFADCLTDWDPASNAMNWQWVAGCGPDASPYFRIFNPELQAQKFDPKGLYRRRWLAGFDGAGGPEAQAWEESIPSAWRGADWQPLTPEALADGRSRALAALAQFKTGA